MRRPTPKATRRITIDLPGLVTSMLEFATANAARGCIYALEDRVGVLGVEADGKGFTAEVRGTHLYRVAWFFEDGDWVNVCSCPLGGDCKHAYATTAVLVAQLVARRDDIPAKLRHRFPLPLVGSPRLPAVRLVKDIFTDAGPHFDDSEVDDDTDFEDDDRGGDVWDEHPHRAPARRATPLRRTSQSPNPRPARMNPETVRKEAHKRLEQQLRSSLAGWSGELERSYQKQLRAVVRLHLDTRGSFRVELSTLLTSKMLRDKPRRREQLTALADEIAYRPDVLSPASTGLLRWVNRHYAAASWSNQGALGLTSLESLLIAAGESGLVTWKLSTDDGNDIARLAGCCDGQVARMARAPAEIIPVCAGENDARIELQVRLGDCGERPLRDVLYLADTNDSGASYVIADGLLWRVTSQPPRAILDGFHALGTIELEPEQRCEVLRKLGTQYSAIARTLADHTVRVEARANFLLDADSTGQLHLRLFAAPAQAAWHPGGNTENIAGNAPPRGRSKSNPRSATKSLAGGSLAVFEYLRPGYWQPLADPGLPVTTRSVLDEGEQPWHEVAAVPTQESSGGQPPSHTPQATAFDSLPIDAAENLAAAAAQAAAGDAAQSPALTQAAIWQTEPDPDSVAAATAWLNAVAGVTFQRDPHEVSPWTLTLRPPHFERLVEAWQSRPRDALYYATRRVQRMLHEGPSAKAQIAIKSSGKDWFAIKLDWQLEGKALTPDEIAALLRSREAFVRLGDSWVNTAALGDARAAIDELADAGIDALAGEQRVSLWQLASAPSKALAQLEMLGADADTIEAARELRRRVAAFSTLPRVPMPRRFHGELRAYQRDGLDFLSFTSSLGTGAVLADDMGLGKTVQALAWLERLRSGAAGGSREDGPALVVCPASVVHNWKDEAARFAPKLRVAALASGRERHDLLDRLGDFDLVITNYALLRRDHELWKKHKIGALVLDEAQNVKNPDAEISRIVRSLPARHRLALTGTPLENRTRDVWSIVECVSPGYLGTRRRFEQRFDRPDLEDSDRRLLAARLRPLMLRRRKSEVAQDLPARTEEVRYCDLGAEQRKLYLATLRASRRLVADLDQSGQAGQRARIHVLAALTKLRQICCHQGLVEPTLAALPSAKFDLLMEIVEPLLEEGHKVLVFSQFARCVALLAAELGRREVRHHVLTGATQRRDKVVAAFQEETEPSVFLISLKAGGTGLNLTAASYVVLFDPWWNPAVEAQAIDRTHRIGQTRSVMAYRLVASDTIEEKILELQRDKASLADAVVDDATFGRRLAKEDLARLLTET